MKNVHVMSWILQVPSTYGRPNNSGFKARIASFNYILISLVNVKLGGFWVAAESLGILYNTTEMRIVQSVRCVFTCFSWECLLQLILNGCMERISPFLNTFNNARTAIIENFVIFYWMCSNLSCRSASPCYLWWCSCNIRVLMISIDKLPTTKEVHKFWSLHLQGTIVGIRLCQNHRLLLTVQIRNLDLQVFYIHHSSCCLPSGLF